MTNFQDLLDRYVTPPDASAAKVHGVIAQCVDGNGRQIYSKIAGKYSLAGDAKPLDEKAVLRWASASKFITSIALLQCIEKGLIGIDAPLTKILPEFANKNIVSMDSTALSGLSFAPSNTKITARHLLTHTSGLGYWFLNPKLMKWKAMPEGKEFADSKFVHEKMDTPLSFEPGQGWEYGTSLDWAGVVVRRLHGGISLEKYMNEHIWEVVGAQELPTFHLSRDPEYKKQLLQGVQRTAGGGLEPYEFWQGDDALDQPGGHGLCGTSKDWLAVLTDLVSDSPRLLKPETIEMMFTPQIQEGSVAMAMLHAFRPAWEMVAGPVETASAINHGLGGLLVTQEVPAIGQPKNILAWGGAANTVWFLSREHRVGGFFSTQLHPFGDPIVKELVDAWKKDFWTSLTT